MPPTKTAPTEGLIEVARLTDTILPARKRRSLLSHREAKVALAVGDVLALVVPFFAALTVKSTGHLDRSDLLAFAIGLVTYWTFAIAGNLYSVGRASSFTRTQRASICGILAVLIAAPAFRCPAPIAPFHQPYFFVALGGVLIVAWRTSFAALMQQIGISTRRLLVIGAGVAGAMLADAIAEKRAKGESDYELVGFIDDDVKKRGMSIFGARVLGTSASTSSLIQQCGADTLVLSINSTNVYSASVFDALLTARVKGVTVVSMPALYESVMGRVPVTHVGDNWGVMFPVEHQQPSLMSDIITRGVDVVVGLAGCLFLLAVSPFIYLANAIMSPGPLFYSQSRVGKGGKTFKILKFRSMVVNAEAAKGAVWCAEDDPRITKVGNLLRKTRLDEIPQFWNVLTGDMSFVGPRPERPEFVEMLSETIPFYNVRHAIKPGITGWAQVMYRYGASEEDSMMKLQYDLYYIKHRSVALDLYILARTIKVVLGAAGR